MLAGIVALSGCGADAEKARLVTGCVKASPDNRARLAASFLTRAHLEVDGKLVTVTAEVPAGISIRGTLRFRRWIYRCRNTAEGLEFIDARMEPIEAAAG